MKTQFPSHKSCKHGGFSLIELLSVLSIIAVLSTILFPVFSRVRENARRTSCLSNLKQIGTGLMQYIQDNDEQNTKAWYGVDSQASTAEGSVPNQYKWMDAIFPYVKSEQLFDCPSHPQPYISTSFGPYRFRTGKKWGSYGVNVTYYPTTSSTVFYNPFQSPHQASWESPSTTVYAVDGSGRFEIAWPDDGTNPSVGDGPPRYLYSPFSMLERHLGTTAVLFCDGHAKAQKLEKFMTVGTLGRYSPFTVQADPN